MIAPAASDYEAYFAAVAAARRAGLALAGDGQVAMLALLAEWADELAEVVERTSARKRRTALREEVTALFDRLGKEMESATSAGVRLTAERVASIHAEATASLARTVGLDTRPLFSGVDVRAAQAVLARGDYSTAIKSFPKDSARSALRIIQRGQIRGAPTTAVARELRLFVGAPESLIEGDAAALRDRRRIGYAMIEELGYDPTPENLGIVRAEAGRIAARAQLIARTERLNAEHEAHTRSLIASPVIACVAVRTSARHVHRDQCDAAADADLFGLGPGRYPPERVPARFHPRCLCNFVHELRPPAEWSQPRRQYDPWSGSWGDLQAEHQLSPSQARAFAAALRVSDSRAEEEGRSGLRRSGRVSL